jgi:hypothetical protein
MAAGIGMPVLVNPPTPSAWNKNFWMPSETKPAPTARRTGKVAEGQSPRKTFASFMDPMSPMLPPLVGCACDAVEAL